MASSLVSSCAGPTEVPSEEWDALVARPPASVNCSRAWVSGALASVDRQRTPQLLTVHADGQLVALLPLALDRAGPRPTLRLVGSPYHDLADVLVRPGHEQAAVAVVTQLRALTGRGWSVDLDLLDPDGALIAADRERALLAWEPSQCAPLIDLGGDWRCAASPRRRRQWRSHRRRLERLHALEFRWIEGDEVVPALPEFVRVREGRLRLKRYPLDPLQVELLNAVVPPLAAAGRCAFAELRLDGAMVARDLYLLDGRVGLMWLRALDVAWMRYACGHLLLRWSAESLAAKGFEALDLGCGGEPYKFVFGAEPRMLLRASAHPAA